MPPHQHRRRLAGLQRRRRLAGLQRRRPVLAAGNGGLTARPPPMVYRERERGGVGAVREIKREEKRERGERLERESLGERERLCE